MRPSEFAERLQAKPTGAGKWQAKCPAHEDKQASLSIKTGDDGRTLIKCHAGCEPAAIVEAMGLKLADLFVGEGRSTVDGRRSAVGEGKRMAGKSGSKPKNAPSPQPSPPGEGAKKPLPSPPRSGEGAKKKIVATYDYVDAGGKLVYQIVRYEPKTFKCRQPKGNGDWLWSREGIETIPYNLPECLAAIEAKKPIFVVEGEKDVITLAGLGLTATSCAFGAGNWEPQMSELLSGAHLVVIPDNDTPGWNHAALVAFLSATTAASIRIVELEGFTKEKQDVTDWLELGHTKDELISQAKQLPSIRQMLLEEPTDEELAALLADEHSGPAGDADLEDTPFGVLTYHQTDLGNAEAFVKAHGNDVHYCRGLSKDQYLVWGGTRWVLDESGEVQRRAQDTVRECYARLPELKQGRIDDAYKHLKRSERSERLNAMMTLARYADKRIPVRASDLDANPFVFNVQNGTLDLQTGEMRPHSRNDLITKISPVTYDPTAECIRWFQFLAEVFGNDTELIRYIQRITGYCLTGSVKEQVLFILMGKGANGKSVFVETLRKLLGDYGCDTAVTTFTERASDASTVGLASLYGSRMVSAAEGSGDQVFDEALIKKLTGGDPITARHLYCPFITYTPTFKLLISSNESPRLRGQGYAIKRRVRIIPLTVRFYEEHDENRPQNGPLRDPNLTEKLASELPGILNWALEGCLEWQRNGLGMPKAVREDTDKLFSDQDPLLEWLMERCELVTAAETQTGDLWRDYAKWCKDNDRDTSFRNAQSFSRNLSQRDGIETFRTNKARFLRGIQLREATEEEKAEEYAKLFEGQTSWQL